MIFILYQGRGSPSLKRPRIGDIWLWPIICNQWSAYTYRVWCPSVSVVQGDMLLGSLPKGVVEQGNGDIPLHFCDWPQAFDTPPANTQSALFQPFYHSNYKGFLKRAMGRNADCAICHRMFTSHVFSSRQETLDVGLRCLFAPRCSATSRTRD